MRQYLWRHIVGSLTIPPVYAVEIKQFICLLHKNYTNLISYPHQTISIGTWNKNRNSESSVYCKIQRYYIQGDRRHQPASWIQVSKWSTQSKDFVRPMLMIMGKTAGRMLHMPLKNSKNTGTKESYCLVNHCDIEKESEVLKTKSSSGNGKQLNSTCKPKYIPCKSHRPSLSYKQILETPRAVNQHQPGGLVWSLSWLKSSKWFQLTSTVFRLHPHSFQACCWY